MLTLADLSPDLTLWIAQVLLPTAFIFAFGACVGSLTNVLVYRMPLGLSVVHPPSACPCCQTRLTWRENIPILGWLLLRGRCRFCRSPISPEYPLVEFFMAALFAAVFIFSYHTPASFTFLDAAIGSARPTWSVGSAALAETWPLFVLTIGLLACLVAMTLTDLKTFTIPMGLSLTPAALALVIHPAWAAYRAVAAEGRPPIPLARDWHWSIPTSANPAWIVAAFAGLAGLGVSLLLIRLGVLKRSFDDFPQWEEQLLKDHPHLAEPEKPRDPKIVLRDLALTVGLAIVFAAIGVSVISIATTLPRWCGALAGAAAGVIVAAILGRLLDKPVAKPDEINQAEAWTQYPHARREMVRELAFLAPPALFAYLAFIITDKLSTNADGLTMAHWPLWIEVFAGVIWGYLVGGGVVWGIRLFGSLAFGKEAMGLGDVHLLAGAGAVLGWINVVFAFFLAALVGMLWFVVSWVRSGSARRAMPYGPYLAVAVVAVMFARPLVERFLSALIHAPEPIILP